MLNNIPKLISNEGNSYITKDVEETKIIRSIWELVLEKSLASHGFSIHFFYSCWDIIKMDLKHMLNHFQKM